MADKSFGVKELNLLNASGTPTVTSPNNLNLNANTVAISTSCTIGNNLTITSTTTSANVNVTGIATVVNFNATGISTIAQPADSNPMANWTITNNSASAYRFTGPGQSGTEDNPNIYLVRGHRYIFKHNATGSHPIQIRFASGGSAYTDGITYSDTGNNRTTDGNNLIFNVQHDAPAQLFYQCTAHGGMVGNIYTVGGPQVISGVITATSFSGSGANLTSLPAQATIANNGNDRIITGGSGVNLNGEANLQFDGTDLYVSDNIKHLGDPDTLIEFATDTITFDTAGSERLRIASAGLVGINTDSPSAAWLDIASDSGSYDHLRLRRLSSDSNIASNWSMKPYGGNLYFRSGGSTDKIYFDDSGDLNIMDGNLIMGTAGHGIDFSATSDGNGTDSSELLDDYEEGTWTPGIGGSSGSVTSYHNQEGGYTKIGRLVKCHFRLRVNDAGNAAGNMEITNLPYTVANTLASTGLDGSGGPTYWASQSTAIVNMTMTPQGGNTKAWIYIATGATTTMSNLTNGNAFGNNWDVRAELMYFAA